jgi:ankyrin repeat protein
MNCECISLFSAIENRHEKCIDLFSNDDINIFPTHYSPIGYSAFEINDLCITKKLLKYPHLRNIKNSLGYTCVHEAVIFGNINYLKLFWNGKCDFNCLTDDKDSVFHLSVRKNNCEIKNFLKSRVNKKFLKLKNIHEKTPIDLSIELYEKNIFETEDIPSFKIEKEIFIFEKEE